MNCGGIYSFINSRRLQIQEMSQRQLWIARQVKAVIQNQSCTEQRNSSRKIMLLIQRVEKNANNSVN